MPLNLFKLPCGVIYTDTFSRWLAARYAEEAPQHPRQLLTFDYVRCKTGAQQGNAWWRLDWIPEDAAPLHRRFRMNNLLVHISKATQHGLRERCLDWNQDKVVVRP